MRLVFAGTPAVAVPTLEALLASTHDVVGVITRPDAPVGRRRTLTPSPVAEIADAAGVPTLRTARLDDSATDWVEHLRPDLGVVVAYGALVRPRLLAVPPSGWINSHFSVLPRWRGAAPVQRALMAGDDTTGVTVFRLVEELDAGDVYGTMTTGIRPWETAGDLLARLASESVPLLGSVVDAIASGEARALPQEGDPTIAAKPTASEAAVDWSRESRVIDGLIRGVTPEPGAHTSWGDARIKVLEQRPVDDAPVSGVPGTVERRAGRVLVSTGGGVVELLRVQPAGRSAMDAGAWANGLPRDGSVVLG